MDNIELAKRLRDIWYKKAPDWEPVAKEVQIMLLEARIDSTHQMIPAVNLAWTNPNGLELAKQAQERGYKLINEITTQLQELRGDNRKLSKDEVAHRKACVDE